MESGGKTLSQVRAQKATIVLIAPVWKTQAWYPTLLGMLVDFPHNAQSPRGADTADNTNSGTGGRASTIRMAYLRQQYEKNTFLTWAQSCCLHHGG